MSIDNTIFQITNNNVFPQKGSILISEPFLESRYFGRSVVLLVEHNDRQGSMGFVINKKEKQTLNRFFSELKQAEEISLFRGGPVSTDKLFFIHTLGDIIPQTIPISNGLYFDGDFNVAKQYLINGHSAKGVFKFVLGYSGWNQNQLQDKITVNSWLVSKMDAPGIMREDGEGCWKESLQNLGDRYKAWVNFPRHSFLN